ncbi:hypothetical protein IL38_24150 [Actinopolyspora erythraea]|uniref:PKD domain-containing protein n=1 Tax=Actinopolyspora erythraea TaxID=414996 RepID=A0ABR4WYC8_9ACTN|nr:hypothetical protein [Actinopolyspora erythraea]KGI79391.1 hypothetical protein IL38_24150 [Actinopolyspora erythraea]
MTWEPDPEDLLGVRVTVHGPTTASGAELTWGDDSDAERVPYGSPVHHVYPTAGSYTVTALDVDTGELVGTALLPVKGWLPEAWAFLNGDDVWEALVWVDEPADETQYRITWGDGSEQIVKGQKKVPPRPRVPHVYPEVGQYPVTVTDLASQRSIAGTVEIGEIGVLVTYPKQQPQRPRVWAKWLQTGARWRIDWGNGGAPVEGTVPASGYVVQLAPEDLSVGEHTFVLDELVDGVVRRTARRTIHIPTQWDWRMDVDMSWFSNEARTEQTVTIAPNGARSTCTVEWGDGSPTEQVEPGASLPHVYTLPTPEAGRRLVITETETSTVTDPRTFSRLVAEPRYVGQPLLNARGRRSVDLDVAGVDGPTNGDWYRISWGDGSSSGGTDSIDEVGALGRWFPATHYYQSDGEFPITVDAPGMAEPIRRSVWVTVYPSPTLTVEEALDGKDPVDPTRMTVEVTVNNAASGGPCHVDVGDGSPPVACAEEDTFRHQYATADRFVLVATSDADTTAKDRTRVHVPFGGGPTLLYTISQGSSEWEVVLTLTDWDTGKSVWVNWDDGVVDEVPATTGTKKHGYADTPWDYTLQIYYGDNSEYYEETVSLPWGNR